MKDHHLEFAAEAERIAAELVADRQSSTRQPGLGNRRKPHYRRGPKKALLLANLKKQ